MQRINPITIKRMFYQFELPAFHNLMNLWAIEDNAVIGLDLQMSFVYELELPDLIHKQESDIAGFFQMMKNSLHSLPENVTLQFVVETLAGDNEKIKQYTETVNAKDDIARLVVDYKTEHLKNVFLQKRKYYMFLTTYPEETDISNFSVSVFKIINTDYKPVTQALHDKRIKKLKELETTLLSELKSAGLKIRQLGCDEITRYLYRYLNPSRAELLEPKVRQDETLRSKITLNACEHSFDHIYLDGYYYRAVNLHTRPESVNFVMLADLLNTLTPDYDIVFTVQSPNQEQMVKQLQMTDTQSKIISNINTLKRYYEADLKAEQAEGLIKDVKSSFQKLYNYSLCVIIRDRSLEELTAKTNAAVQAFRVLGESEGVIDDMNHLFLYMTAMPGHSHLNLRKHIFQTEAIAQLLPLSAPWTGCSQPKIIFQTDDNQLLPIDLFEPSLPAKHGLVLGTTGSGKSFTTNFLLTNFFIESEKNHIVIIDIGGSYRKLASLFGGQYLEIELSEDFAFNPFAPKETAIINSDKENFELDPDTVAFLTLLVQKMVTKKQELDGREQKILENAITAAYRCSKNNPPILSDLHKQLVEYAGDNEDKKTAMDFAKNLEMYTTGRFGKLLNRSDSIHPDSRLVVFDLQKLQEQPELQTIIFFLIRSVIEDKMRDTSLRKMIVIDEGWRFFSDDVGSQLIQNLYRTARKFNAMILSISQSPDDFLSTKAANAIISNSYTKYILKLQKGHELLSQFQLSEPEIEEVKNLTSVKGKYSEVFLKFADNCRVIKIEPSKVDYWICTTDPDDTQKELRYRQEHPEATAAQVLEGLASGRACLPAGREAK